jgi:hypothetical protein
VATGSTFNNTVTFQPDFRVSQGEWNLLHYCMCVSTVRSLIALKSVLDFNEIRFERLTERYQASTVSTFYHIIFKLFFSDYCSPRPPNSTFPISALRVNLTLRRSVKAIIITYSECISVALVIQHALRLRRIILSSVACHMFPHFHINGTIFGKKDLLNKKFVTCFDFL